MVEGRSHWRQFSSEFKRADSRLFQILVVLCFAATSLLRFFSPNESGKVDVSKIIGLSLIIIGVSHRQTHRSR